MTADVPAHGPSRPAPACIADHRVDRLVLDGGRATRAARHRPGRSAGHDRRPPRVRVRRRRCRRPALLQRSGLRRRIGSTLAVHPTVKLAAHFPDPVNVPDDVPVHQVTEFAPDLSFGGSASSPGLAALGAQRLVGPLRPGDRGLAATRRLLRGDHERGTGQRCTPCPGLRDPLVTYRLTRRDRALLGRGTGPPRPADARGRGDRRLPVLPRRAGRAPAGRPGGDAGAASRSPGRA